LSRSIGARNQNKPSEFRGSEEAEVHESSGATRECKRQAGGRGRERSYGVQTPQRGSGEGEAEKNVMNRAHHLSRGAVARDNLRGAGKEKIRRKRNSEVAEDWIGSQLRERKKIHIRFRGSCAITREDRLSAMRKPRTSQTLSYKQEEGGKKG